MGFWFSKPELKENEIEFMGMRFACTQDYFIETYREEGELIFIMVYYYFWIWIAVLSWLSWAFNPFYRAVLWMKESWNANLVLWGSMGV